MMIPVAKGGRSFKGAVLYHAHDKKALTSERLGFVELLNLPILASGDGARDMERAGSVMAWTATHQAEIHRHHHMKTAPETPYKRPRKTTFPVYSFAIRFAPEDAHKVDAALLRMAAHGALKTLGMEKCQAIILEHKDSIPTHVHVIVNRIDAKTGIAVPTSRDFLKLSVYAERFCKEHGLTRLKVREDNNARRRRGEIVKYQGLTRSQWELMRGYRGKTRQRVEKERFAQQSADRQELDKRQRDQIKVFKAKIDGQYRKDRTTIERQIAELGRQATKRGLFASATRTLKRLTGAERRQQHVLAALRKTRANIDSRVAEMRAPFARTLREERARLANRHKAELLRDAQYFEARERQRSEEDRTASRRRRHSFQNVARDRRNDGVESLIMELSRRPAAEEAGHAGESDVTREVRERLWRRGEERGLNRPKRPRRRTGEDDGPDISPDRPRRRR